MAIPPYPIFDNLNRTINPEFYDDDLDNEDRDDEEEDDEDEDS